MYPEWKNLCLSVKNGYPEALGVGQYITINEELRDNRFT